MKEEGVVAFKTHLDWSLYRDVKPVPTIPLSDDIAIAPPGPVLIVIIIKIML